MTDRVSFKWIVGIASGIIAALTGWLFNSLANADELQMQKLDRHDQMLSSDRERLSSLEATLRAQDLRLTRIDDGVDKLNAKLDKALEKR